MASFRDSGEFRESTGSGAAGQGGGDTRQRRSTRQDAVDLANDMDTSKYSGNLRDAIQRKNIDIKKAKWNGDIKIDDHYELTTDHNDLKGYDVLLITRTRPTPTMESKATSAEKVNSFNFKTNKRQKTFNLYILKNWK